VAERVVELVDADAVVPMAASYGWTPEAGPLKEFLAGRLLEQMTVESSIGSSRVMQIGFVSGDPDHSASMANSFAQAFIDVNLALQTEPARRAAQAYEQQLTRKAEELREAEQRLAALQRDLGVIDPAGAPSADNVGLTTLATQLANATAAAETASSQTRAGSLPAVEADAVIAQLDVQLASLRSQLAQLETIAGPNNAQVRQLRNQIASLETQKRQQESAARRSKAAEAAQARMVQQGIAGQVAAQMQRTIASQAAESELSQAKLDVAGVQQAYDQMAQRRTQLQVLGESGQTNISILTPALPSVEPVGPGRLWALLLGILVGLAAGMVVAILFELSNLKIRLAEELDAWLGIPDLGSVRAAAERHSLPRRRLAGLLPSIGSS
ncbi:GNVR domain-containing protein, partial [Hoeflea sp.]|uniref:GNVR domain-containing protein n=1 Tax=Hoeflea sp. TaxID=1940281 RepID=UPI00198F7E09